MITLLVVLAAWCLVSVPASLVLGVVLARRGALYRGPSPQAHRSPAPALRSQDIPAAASPARIGRADELAEVDLPLGSATA